MRIDLHAHTTISDGTDTPTQLVRKAKAVGVDVLGITDHDTTAGWEEASQVAVAEGVSLVRGAEISCSIDGRTVHMLAYLFRPEPRLTRHFEDATAVRRERARQIVDNLAADYPITWENVLAIAGESQVVGRPHIADALIAAGVFHSREEVFATVLHPKHKYYVHYQAPDPREVIADIRAAGGVPVWAHPRATKRGKVVPTAAFSGMVTAGLFGVEVWHRDHSPEMVAAISAIADHYGLEKLGSSDYHGTGKPNQLGENWTRAGVLEKILQQGALPLI